jgi:hypothetical protein
VYTEPNAIVRGTLVSIIKMIKAKKTATKYKTIAWMYLGVELMVDTKIILN